MIILNKDLNYYLLRQKALSNKFNTVCYDYLNGKISQDVLYSYFDYIDSANKEIKEYCSGNGYAMFSDSLIDASYILRHCTAYSYEDSMDYINLNDVDEKFDFDEVVKTNNKTISDGAYANPNKDDESKTVEENVNKPDIAAGAADHVDKPENVISDNSSSSDFDDLDIPVYNLDEEDVLNDKSDLDAENTNEEENKPIELESDENENRSEELIKTDADDNGRADFIDVIHKFLDLYFSDIDKQLRDVEFLKSLGDPIKGHAHSYSLNEVLDARDNDDDKYFIIIDDIKKQVISDSLLAEADFNKLSYSESLAGNYKLIHNIMSNYGDSSFKYFPDEYKNLNTMTYDQFVGFCSAFDYDISKLPQIEPIVADGLIVENPKNEKVGKITGIKNGKSKKFDDCLKNLNSLIFMVSDCTGFELNSEEFDFAFNEIIKGDKSKYDEEKVNDIIEKYNYIKNFLKTNKVSTKGIRINDIDTLNASKSFAEIYDALNESKDRGKKVASDLALKAVSFLAPLAASTVLRSVPTFVAAPVALGAHFAEKGLSTLVEKKGKQNKMWSKIALTATKVIKNAGIYSIVSKFGLAPIGLLAAGSGATLGFAKYRLKNLDPENETNYDNDKVSFSESGKITSIKDNIKLFLNDRDKLNELSCNALKSLMILGASAGTKVIGDLAAVNDLNSGELLPSGR